MLNEALIKDVLDEAMSLGADFAEIYVEQTESQSIDMVGGKVDKANRGQDYGLNSDYSRNKFSVRIYK